MTKRLQVLLEAEELAEIRRAARRRRQTVAEWVRGALRAARKVEEGRSARDKLDAVRIAARSAYPTGSIEQILADIERGYADVHEA